MEIAHILLHVFETVQFSREKDTVFVKFSMDSYLKRFSHKCRDEDISFLVRILMNDGIWMICFK